MGYMFNNKNIQIKSIFIIIIIICNYNISHFNVNGRLKYVNMTQIRNL